MKYLDRLKNKKAIGQGTAKSAKSPEDQILDPFYSYCSNPERHFSKNNLEDLLSEVGAEIVSDESGHVLRFKPYLAGPAVDPERWAKAVELEKMFRADGAEKQINKQTQKKKNLSKSKKTDKFEELRKSVRRTIDGLTAWADRRMIPETEDEAIAAKAIMASGANMLVQYSRLGLDIEGTFQTFIEDPEDRFNKAKPIN